MPLKSSERVKRKRKRLYTWNVMYLVILFKEKNVRGSGTEPGRQVRTGLPAIPFLPQLPHKENYAIQAFCGMC